MRLRTTQAFPLDTLWKLEMSFHSLCCQLLSARSILLLSRLVLWPQLLLPPQQPFLPELHSGKNVFLWVISGLYLQLPTFPTCSSMGYGFRNHRSYKKKMTGFSGQKKIIILLLSACHMTLVCLIFSATLLSYFINQKLRAKKERQRWNITLFHTHKSTFPLTTAWQFLLVITFPSFSLGGQVVMGREELGIKTCLPKILVLIISWSQVTFFININLYVLVVS